ncbi:hypothetical protein [Nocardia sp. NPDC058480]|uniref:hypothetical protein n=1 Tax=Nocardia sp. NPDC058480 TaxID=3346522 RepID=UPI00364EA1F4
MTTLETRVMGVLDQPGRLLYPETLAAILQQPLSEILYAVESLHRRRLAWSNRCGQWSARRAGPTS